MKTQLDESLWFKGKSVDTHHNEVNIYAAPVDLIDEESINDLHRELFIYKTKFDPDTKQEDLTKDQVLIGSVTTDWYIVSRYRLSLTSEVNFSRIHIKFSYCKSGDEIMYGDSYKEIGSFFFARFFNKSCICLGADKTFNDNNGSYISNFLGYIVRNEKLNVFKVVRNIYIIGQFTQKEMNDYCAHTFCDIDDVLGDYSEDIDLWQTVIPAVAE